jgi:hypothetical protein
VDEQRFDTLARSIGAIRSRRSVITALSGAAVAGVLCLGSRETAAAPKPAGAKCGSDTQCASGTCIQYGKCKKNGKLTGKCRCACSATDVCPTAKTCSNQPNEIGACFSPCSSPGSCATGFARCNGRSDCACVATDIDPSCVGRSFFCSTVNDCTTTADCPVGQVCASLGGMCACDGTKAQLCLNPCGVGATEPQTSASSGVTTQAATNEASRDEISTLPSR